jgi:excisionase family DNA binding protein
MKTTSAERPGYLRRAAAARYMSVSLRALAEYQKRRQIAFHKIGGSVLFKVADMDAFIERFRINAVGGQ